MEVQNDLDKAKHVAITTDMWTATTTDQYNAVTAHFINEEKQIDGIFRLLLKYLKIFKIAAGIRIFYVMTI